MKYGNDAQATNCRQLATLQTTNNAYIHTYEHTHTHTHRHMYVCAYVNNTQSEFQTFLYEERDTATLEEAADEREQCENET